MLQVELDWVLAAVTSRGMNTEDMDVIAEAISILVKDNANKDKAMALVKSLTDKYPLYR